MAEPDRDPVAAGPLPDWSGPPPGSPGGWSGPPPGSPGGWSGTPPGSPGGSPGPPDPPRGPGVQPPFVAAPVEGRRTRTWLGLGVAGAILAACCGVGVVAIGALLVVGQEAVNEQARRAVDDYLAAVADQDWPEAYELRCRRDRQAESLSAFTDRISAQPRIGSYQVGEMDPAPDGAITVPVQVTYLDGSADRLIVPIEQSSTGQLEVCGQIRPE